MISILLGGFGLSGVFGRILAAVGGLLLVMAVFVATEVGAQDVSEQVSQGTAQSAEAPTPGSAIEPRPIASPVSPVDSALVPRQATFDTGEPMAMAVFLRDNALWLVFSAEATLDAPTLARQGELGLGAVRVAEARGGVALRFDNIHMREPIIGRRGTQWTVDLPVANPVANETASGPTLEVFPQPDHEAGARLFIEAAGATGPVAFVDPIVGDILVAMPLGVPDQGIAAARRFVEFQLLPSTLGVVIRTGIEDIRLRATEGGIAITSEQGLQLS